MQTILQGSIASLSRKWRVVTKRVQSVPLTTNTEQIKQYFLQTIESIASKRIVALNAAIEACHELGSKDAVFCCSGG